MPVTIRHGVVRVRFGSRSVTVIEHTAYTHPVQVFSRRCIWIQRACFRVFEYLEAEGYLLCSWKTSCSQSMMSNWMGNA